MPASRMMRPSTRCSVWTNVPMFGPQWLTNERSGGSAVRFGAAGCSSISSGAAAHRASVRPANPCHPRQAVGAARAASHADEPVAHVNARSSRSSHEERTWMGRPAGRLSAPIIRRIILRKRRREPCLRSGSSGCQKQKSAAYGNPREGNHASQIPPSRSHAP